MPDRSFHFVPADRPEWFGKALNAGADAVVFDLEDAVAAENKSEAIKLLSVFGAEQSKGVAGFVRVNGTKSLLAAEENRLLEANPRLGVIFPKIDDVAQCEAVFAHYPSARGRKTIVLIESAAGLVNCPQILARCSPFAVGLGLEDLLSNSVFPREELGDFVRSVRCRLALDGAAYDCLTIDSVSLDTTGGESFAHDCAEARACGLRAKFTIHPAQIAITNRFFSPGAAAVAEARALLNSCHQHTAIGYRSHNGKIISPPALAKAKLIADFTPAHAIQQ